METLRWRDGQLKMIDQRKLPTSFNYIGCDSAEAVAGAIRTMVVRGAPAIGVAAAYGVALEALRCQMLSHQAFTASMHKGIDRLAASRPTAVNLFWALARMKQAWDQNQQADNEHIAQRLVEEAQAIHREDIHSNRQMGRFGAELLPESACVLTHCNAGALATAGHGTALGVIRSAIEQGKNISVIAGETRPFLQGARLTAWEMVQENIPVTLITDNMAGFMMDKGEIDAVIVGADRVARNGDAANKIGTYMLAVLARHHQIPFYIACPTSTIDTGTLCGADIPIEERCADEVTGFGEQQWAPSGVLVRNPSFDVTPAHLISGLITEQGVILEPNDEKIQKLCADRCAPPILDASFIA